MATNTWPGHIVRTLEHERAYSDRVDSVYDTAAQESIQILSLADDVDGEYDEDNTEFLRHMNDQHGHNDVQQDPNTMLRFKVADNETFSAAAASGNAISDTPPPSETTTPASNVPVRPKRSHNIILKMSSKRALCPPTDSLTTQAPATTKSGRRSKARKIQDDTLMGSEYNGFFEGFGSGGGRLDQDYIPSSPPVTSVKRGLGRSLKPKHVSLNPTEDIASSSTVEGEEADLTAAIYQGLTSAHGNDANSTAHPFYADIPQDIHDFVARLAAIDPVEVNLCSPITNVWTAEQLTHIYISAYQSHYWHVCDLIADTWIRAFQNLNKTSPIWRANRSEYLYKARNPAEIGLHKFDPPLDRQVCAFEAKLLNNLYHHTDNKCGARMLWADSMALVGAEWEAELTSRERRHNKWHPDLIFNVMCTALRMVAN
jgi:hypothetical protein